MVRMHNQSGKPTMARRLAALAEATGISPEQVPFVNCGRPTGDDGMSVWRKDIGNIALVNQGKVRSQARQEAHERMKENVVRARLLRALGRATGGDY